MVLFWCDFASKRQTQAAGGAEAYLMEKKEGEVREDQSTLQLSDCQTVNDSAPGTEHFRFNDMEAVALGWKLHANCVGRRPSQACKA